MTRLSITALAVMATGCTAPSITSDTLSESEIQAIQSRVEDRYPDLAEDKQRAVTELVVRAMDNMVFVEGGSFMMGEFGVPCEPGSKQRCMSDFDPSNDHAHKVTLDDYYLARYETTMGDFDLFRELKGRKPYAYRVRQMEDRQHLFASNKPAWTRNGEEPKEYCLWLGEMASHDVDLPTEAQWEFAARNRGQKVRYATNDGTFKPGKNVAVKSLADSKQPVGEYPPNPLGLYDLTSNASEWVNDWHSVDYYQVSPVENPTGPSRGQSRVVRSDTTVLRQEGPDDDGGYYPGLGFRCATR